MTLFNRLLVCCVAAAFVFSPSMLRAHDGHSHNNSRNNDYNFNDVPLRGGAGTQFRPNATRDPDSCSAGGCCRASGRCSIDANDRTTPRNITREQREPRPALPDIERLANRMGAAIKSELRGTREYDSLMGDVDQALSSARRLRQTQASSAPWQDLLAEARRMLSPLRRINRVVSDAPQAERSYQAVQSAGRALVAWTRGLQTESGPPRRRLTLEDLSDRPPVSSIRRNISIPKEMEGIALLPAGEHAAALRQRTCPVTRQPLGSMGKPIRVTVGGQTIYVCCQGCVNPVKQNPAKFLTSLVTDVIAFQ